VSPETHTVDWTGEVDLDADVLYGRYEPASDVRIRSEPCVKLVRRRTHKQHQRGAAQSLRSPSTGKEPGGPFSPLRASLEKRDVAARDHTPRCSGSTDNRQHRAQAHRLAVTRAEAARSLGVSINSFERHVQPELRIVRRGKLRLIPVREIERWLEETRSGRWGRHDGAGYARLDPSTSRRGHGQAPS
jgi:hypothetical protein